MFQKNLIFFNSIENSSMPLGLRSGRSIVPKSSSWSRAAAKEVCCVEQHSDFVTKLFETESSFLGTELHVKGDQFDIHFQHNILAKITRHNCMLLIINDICLC